MNSETRNRFCPQICVVCGDAATGHYYQIAACNGCKNFYRRAILGMKIFKPCPSDGACLKANTNAALKRCRACRFSRCVDGGMNPLCIVSEVPPDKNPLVQEVLRLRKSLKCSSQPSTSKSPVLALEVSPKTPEMLMNRLIDELMFLERAHEKIRRSRFSPVPEDGIPLMELIKGHSKFANDYGVKFYSIKKGYEEHTEDILSILRTPTDRKKRSSCLEKFAKVWPHADLVYSIEYLKTFDVFHRLNQEEQRILVRWVITVCAHLTASYFSFKQKSHVIYHPDGSTIKIICVNESPQKREYHYESVEKIRDLEMDSKEYMLLKAIIVCDPTIEDLTDYGRIILEEQRTRYVKSLFSYMVAKRGPLKEPSQFAEMLKLIDWLRAVNERRKEHHLLRATVGLRPWFCTEDAKDKPLLMDEIFL
ncbi:hypothetical protein PENTCL1PPCAC_16583 [Pristionchus entomophagus]|uniref:Nuclear receptor n=1 Tax=Pristionchus entomophagus TaxID=358040 RepID=A0AAV5TJ34_9BILA|nr:hypothetical protein PENTCL1PPCAC_16583 [Pristionchus entomophagus]